MMDKLDPNVKLLAVLLIFFSLMMFLSEWWFRSDGAFFQGIASGFSGVLGALLGLMTKRTESQTDTLYPRTGTVNGQEIHPPIKPENG